MSKYLFVRPEFYPSTLNGMKRSLVTLFRTMNFRLKYSYVFTAVLLYKFYLSSVPDLGGEALG